MAASVLGKRTRTSTPREAHSTSACSKRRAIQPVVSVSIDVCEDKENAQSAVYDDELTSTTEHAISPVGAGPRSHSKLLDHQVRPASVAVDVRAPEPKTPSKTRHYDVLSENTTPKHRGFPGAPVTPQSKGHPNAHSSTRRNIYQEARNVFTRGSNGSVLVGRENERAELQAFLAERVTFGRSGCLYVSGPPGTGKSAFVTETCRNMVGESSVKYAYANCMSMKSATDVYMDLLNELQPGVSALTDDPRKALLRICSDPNGAKSYLVVLDEIDQLLNLDSAVLHSLFEMSFNRNSRLVLVGIANALDLTDRFLPRLKARNMKPQLLPFLPYSAQQIASILSARCRSLLPTNTTADSKFTPLLLSPAITLISKKVSSQTGDLRKAFDITQRVIDAVEAETREKFTQQQPTPQSSPTRVPLGENPNLSSPAKPVPTGSASQQLLQLTAETAPRATLAHVVRVTSAAFGNGTSQRLKGLSLQQKAILCSLFTLEQRKRLELAELPQTPSKIGRGSLLGTPSKSASASPTMRVLFDAYTSLCKRDNLIHTLSNTEFRDVVGNLETLSLVTSVDGRNGSLSMPGTPSKKRSSLFNGAIRADDKRMSACVGLQELEDAVDGVGSGILKKILGSYELL